MRAVTLSNPEVIKFLSEKVVPFWESVGSVPKVTIDFGGGHVLKRTLGGNVVTYLLSPEGFVYDAFPGVYAPREYLQEIQKTLQIINTLSSTSQDQKVLTWHKNELKDTIRSEEKRITLSKAMVESPLLKALSGNSLSKKPHQLRFQNSETAFEAYAAKLEDISKREATVQQLKSTLLKGLQSNDPDEIGRAAVEIDSRNNVKLLRPAVHLFFSEQSRLPSVQECRETVFRKILLIPLDDPYLGLADALVPGSAMQ